MTVVKRFVSVMSVFSADESSRSEYPAISG